MFHQGLSVMSLLAICHISGAGLSTMREMAYVFEFRPCPGVDTAAEVEASFSYRGNGDYRVNIDWNLNGSYDNMDAQLDIQKCPTRALVDCESYIRFRVDNICTSDLNELNFTSILHSIQPPIKSCPLSGRYTMEEFPIIEQVPQVKKILGFGFIPDNRILSCDFSLIAGDDVLMCIHVVGSFRLMKKSKTSSS